MVTDPTIKTRATMINRNPAGICASDKRDGSVAKIAGTDPAKSPAISIK